MISRLYSFSHNKARSFKMSSEKGIQSKKMYAYSLVYAYLTQKEEKYL